MEGHLLKIEMPNETMKAEIEREMGSLMRFLRNKISNTDIQLEIKVNREKAKKYAFTPQEKYQKLKEKNPLIDELKDLFGLDI